MEICSTQTQHPMFYISVAFAFLNSLIILPFHLHSYFYYVFMLAVNSRFRQSWAASSFSFCPTATTTNSTPSICKFTIMQVVFNSILNVFMEIWEVSLVYSMLLLQGLEKWEQTWSMFWLGSSLESWKFMASAPEVGSEIASAMFGSSQVKFFYIF